MNSKLPVRKKMDDRVALVLPSDEKLRLFKAAAARGVTVSQLIRTAIAQVPFESTAVRS